MMIIQLNQQIFQHELLHAHIFLFLRRQCVMNLRQ
jgi:hypothetical protein